MSDTAVILLAAGQSRRHPGQSKLVREFRGKPLALHAATAMSSLAPRVRIAVLGANTAALKDDLTAMDFLIVWNDAPGNGLSGSLAAGIKAARAAEIDAVLICLADMPLVAASHLLALVEKLNPAGGITLVGTRHPVSGVTMPPAAFAYSELDALVALKGDTGARDLLDDAAFVEAPARELTDFDEPADFTSEA